MDFNGLSIQKNLLLRDLTTIEIGGPARYFADVKNLFELKKAMRFGREHKLPIFILAGGSNVLFSDKGFRGLVIRMRLKGRKIIKEDKDGVVIKVASGEVADNIVEWAVDNNWWGIENLSFIPGSVGAWPVQNVGAYGQTVSDVIVEVEVYDLKEGGIRILSNSECGFGYRRSIFNKEQEGRYIILNVSFRLKKGGMPDISYADLKERFKGRDIKKISLPEIRGAVIEVRKAKGLDVGEYKSAGSFFKNLFLSEKQYEELRMKIISNFGESAGVELECIKNKFLSNGSIKIPAGFIMDKLMNLEGVSVGGAKLSPKRVNSIINTGNARAKDVMALFKKVRCSVYDKTGLKLEPEPKLAGFGMQELEEYFKLN